jgi:intein-encoded DNA endonuclease-like protein
VDTKFRDTKFRNKNYFCISRNFYIISLNFGEISKLTFAKLKREYRKISRNEKKFYEIIKNKIALKFNVKISLMSILRTCSGSRSKSNEITIILFKTQVFLRNRSNLWTESGSRSDQIIGKWKCQKGSNINLFTYSIHSVRKIFVTKFREISRNKFNFVFCEIKKIDFRIQPTLI